MSYDFHVGNKGYRKLLQEKLIGKNPHAIVSVMYLAIAAVMNGEEVASVVCAVVLGIN